LAASVSMELASSQRRSTSPTLGQFPGCSIGWRRPWVLSIS
jgi:hypothetical protein